MRIKILPLLLSLFLILSLLPTFATITEASQLEPQVQVKLKNYLGNKTQITIEPSDTYTSSDEKLILQANTSYTIKLEDTKLNIYSGNKRLFSSDTITLEPISSENYLKIEGRPYKGSFQFTKDEIDKKYYIRPINIIGMEEYVKGVVPNEMYATWELEALKAQAVAARTYSWKINKKIIDDTTNFQVYGGYMTGTTYTNSNKAVEETTGQVLKYGSTLIEAVFSASNGGIVESSLNYWGNTFAYLQIEADPFDTNYLDKNYWNLTVQKTQIDMKNKDLAKPETWWNTVTEKDSKMTDSIKSWLNKNGYKDKDMKIVSIPTLSFTNPSNTSRVTSGSLTVQFYIKDVLKDGKLSLQTLNMENISFYKMKSILGSQVKSSIIFTSSSNTTEHKIDGRQGYGHGVGLSQHGAQNRAEVGQGYKDILAFYYPATNLITEYTKADISAPVIKNTKATYENTNNNVKVTFNIDKSANTTVRIKNSANNIIATPVNNVNLTAGNHTYTIDANNWTNGKYTIEVTAANNDLRNTSITSVEVAKITAPSISSIDTSFDGSTNKVLASFKVNQSATTTVTIKDSTNKILATLANGQSTSAGTLSYKWDVTKVSDGTYTLEILSINSMGKQTTTTQPFSLKKVTTVAPTIKDVKTNYDAKSNKVKVSLHINQASKATVQIKDSKNKVVKTLVNNQSVKAGTLSYSWDVNKVADGSYTISITSTNSNNQKATKSQKFFLKKVTAPTIKDVKTSYNTTNNTVKVNFHVNQSVTTTVKITNSKKKVVKTLASNKSLKSGTHSYTWNVGKSSDGKYTVSIESVNTSKLKKTATKTFTLYKVKTGTVTASTLNIREKPSESSKKVGSVTKNKKVTIYEKSGSWYKIKYGKVSGYVSSKYIKDVK